MNIVIVGGGISGLTAGLMARRMGYKSTVVEARDRFDLHSFGGGIGLWPQSQMVLQRLGLLTQLEKQGLYMPDPYYLNSSGKILAQPLQGFHNRYKILSLQRNVLSRILMNACKQSEVQLLNNTLLQDFSLQADYVKVNLDHGKQLVAHNLIGADGINSLVRTKMLQLIGEKPVQPHHCGYAYFRAVVDLSKQPQMLRIYDTVAFQSWGQGKRFGYVPLKSPKTFWFVAIPIGQKGLQKFQGNHILNQQKKQWLMKQFSHWKGKIDIRKLIEISDPETILRTDIRKMQGVTKFPWGTQDGRIILLGDAANATAPNIAQGAGLAIQSAWDMFSMIDFRNNNQGLQKYLYHRKRRAYTVQSIADTIAFVGQLTKPLSFLRDTSMLLSTNMFPSLEKRIFQATVRYSTGGNSSQKHWLPFINTKEQLRKNVRQQNCLLGSIIGPQEFNKLPQFARKFRSQLIGYGTGTVTVSKVNFFGKLLGLPSNMNDEKFGAYVDLLYENNTNQIQKWTRVFGEGVKKALKYETFHRAGVDYSAQQTGLRLTQSLGLGPDWIRFGYETKINGNKIHYETKNIWFKNYGIYLPKFLLPISQWTQSIHDKSWNFYGTISMPKIFGGKVMMQYKGTFQPQLKVETQRKRKVVIAGGSGMIGSIVSKQFYKNGWKVQVLTRKRVKTMNSMPFVSVHKWNPDKGVTMQNIEVLKYCLQDADVVINLAGHNPGQGPWTDKFKKKILDSRINSINLLCEGLKQCSEKQRIFIQASAAGIYGDKKNFVIDDDEEPSQQKTFRVECCKKIEQKIKSRLPEAIVTRFGHVFSSQDGLYPYIKLASTFGVKNFGFKDRWVPWVHIEDVAGAILHCVEKKDFYKGRQVNIASPNHHTYSQILHYLCDVRGISVLRRITIPDFLMKIFLGEMSSVLLQSQRMNPKLLISTGYNFKHSNLHSAVFTKQCL